MELDTYKKPEIMLQNQDDAEKSSIKTTGLDKKQRIGIAITAIGSLICFISCILTILDNTGAYRGLVLYGFTSIGVTTIVAGFYLIFEP